ncbi:hypothetical protein FA10DRAFT_51205 [Acaromyces ingoldii]|nr:hypothetical protein FA10DRAFT_51205 [Acaromyces ingoldii]PWN86691.1 hypothetical protein FA10DRAFT_51205 [Acaromyces ingoldii]
MSEEFLEAIRLRKGLHPWPSLSIPDVAFPCFIFEAKSDSSVLFFAENQAAGGVAKALKILEGLEREFQEVGGTLEHPLPVIAACTQGALWEVLLGFRIGLEANHCGIHLVQLWLGQTTDKWGLLQLQIILAQIVLWISHTYRPKVEDMLERIRQSFPIHG